MTRLAMSARSLGTGATRPLITVDAPTEALRRRVLAMLPADLLDRTQDDLSAQETVACRIVVAEDLSFPGIRDALRRQRQSDPGTGLVLVTSGDPGNLVYLRNIAFDAVVLADRIAVDLPSTVRRMIERDPVEALACSIEGAPGPPSRVGMAVCAALRARPPFRTIKRLAQSVGVAETALEKDWRRVLPVGAARLSDVLRLVAIERTAELVGTGHQVHAAAQEVGWSVRRLRAAAHVHLGMTLEDATRDRGRAATVLSGIIAELTDASQ